MANYSELLDQINDAIYENNDQEIDALEVRAILRGMVTSLGSGFLFKGIATPSSPGTTQAPDQNVFYLATTAGTYTYLGGLVVAAGEVAFLCYDGIWQKKSSALLSTGAIVDNLTTNDATKVLSAKQGKILRDLVNEGYLLAGVAHPGDAAVSLTGKVVYIATEVGTYTHKGGLAVADGEVAILKYDTAWHKEVTGAATAAQVTELGQELGLVVKSGVYANTSRIIAANAVSAGDILYFKTQYNGYDAKIRSYDVNDNGIDEFGFVNASNPTNEGKYIVPSGFSYALVVWGSIQIDYLVKPDANYLLQREADVSKESIDMMQRDLPLIDRGKVVDNDGGISDNALCCVTSHIPVRESDIVTWMHYLNTIGTGRLGVYDKYGYNITTYSAGTGTGRTLTMPANAAYIIATLSLADIAKTSIQVNGETILDGNYYTIPSTMQNILTNRAYIKEIDLRQVITGDGSNYASSIWKGFIAGNKYRIVLENPDWERDNTGTSATDYIFAVRKFVGGTATYIIVVKRSAGQVNKSYEFVAPECDYIEFGGRANSGTNIVLAIEDISPTIVNYTKNEANVLTDWVNGSYSFTNPVTLTVRSNRVRPENFIPVTAGTKVVVTASSSQWVVLNQFYLDLSGAYSRDVQLFDNAIVTIQNDCMLLPVIGNTDNSDLTPDERTSDAVIYPVVTLPAMYNSIQHLYEEIENKQDLARVFKNIEYAFASKKHSTIQTGSGGSPLNNYSQFLTVVHITDCHGDVERVDRAFDVADRLGAIVVCSGDMVYYYNTDDYTYMRKIQEKYPNVRFLPCIGNHEAWVQQSEVDYTSIADLYTKIISPSINGQSWVFPVGVTNPTYFYYDDTTYKIRFISLNKYMEVNRKENMSQAEVDFFCTSLESLPEDYGVVVIMHSPEGNVVRVTDFDKFLVKEYSAGYSGAGIAKNIIDAFISRQAINTTYTFSAGSVNIDADFTGNTSNDFIGYMTGHIHFDGIGYVSGANNTQLVLCETCTCAWVNRNQNGSSGTGYPDFSEHSDLARQEDTVNQDAFNVYVIDSEKGEVRVVRLGSDLTSDFKKRDYMIIPYK